MIFTFSCGWTVTISYILGTGFFEFCSIVWSPTWTNSLKDGFQTLQTASFLRLLSTQEVSWTQLSSSMARRWFCCLHHAHRGEIITCAMPHLTSLTHTHTQSSRVLKRYLTEIPRTCDEPYCLAGWAPDSSLASLAIPVFSLHFWRDRSLVSCII